LKTEGKENSLQGFVGDDQTPGKQTLESLNPGPLVEDPEVFSGNSFSQLIARRPKNNNKPMN
jgi:hypothetical protein